MKRTMICLVSVVVLVMMMLPAVSPPPVSATAKASVDFKQYANDDDEWIGSILQQNNSKYYECMSVPQRTILVDIPSTAGGEHTFAFSHEATKGGIHAYDWLTAYNQGNDPPLAFDACGENIGPKATIAICQSLHGGSNWALVDVPDDPFISKDGSTQTRINEYESQFGNRQIKIWGDQPITAASLALSHIDSSGDPLPDGGDTGDSDIEYELTWTSNSTQILIEMAGHLALSGSQMSNPIAWGFELGASYVSGGPYHFRLGELDGKALGAQDNQIKGADILPPPLLGTLIAHKFDDLNGNGSQDSGEDDLAGWTMTLYEGSSCNGTLLASGITGLDGDVVFDDLAFGTYSVKETLKDGWTNSTPLCQQITMGQCETVYFGNFELEPDIDVEKTASPNAGAESTNVTFTITVENTGDVTLDPVKVVDTIPAGMSYVSTGTSPLPDSSTDNLDGTWTVTWNNITSLDPGDTTTIYLVAHIDGDAVGTLTNSVTATGTPPYGDDVEDTDTADVRVYRPGIHVEKTAEPSCGAACANITFTIIVTNTNGSVLDPVKVVDTIPEGMSYVVNGTGTAPLPDSYTENPDGTWTVTWNNVTCLDPGATTTIYLEARIDGDELGILTNEVTATGTPPEGDNVEDTAFADVLAIDAKITITPPWDINVVGDEHVLTATVYVDGGDGWEPYEGADVTFEVIDGPGTLDPEIAVTNSSGHAVTTLASTETGTSIITASTSVCGYHIYTDGERENKPAEKEWILARIKIEPQHDINVVGHRHELTATVETSANNGTDWDPYEGATVTFTKTGVGTLNPATNVTDADGEAMTTLTTSEAGNSTVTASTTVYDWDISTDGEAYNSNPAEKEWVLVRIRIDPSEDRNRVGDSHNFTATVETSTNGTDWYPYEGAIVTFEVTDGPGDLAPEVVVTNSSGHAVTTLISTETGTTTVKASTTVYDWDISTDGTANNSDPAEKYWVDARISIFESGVNPVGQEHDFTVTVEKYFIEGTGWKPAAGVSVTPTHTGVGSIQSTGPYITDSSGQVTVTVNSNVTGTATVHASATVSICDIDIDVATNGYGAYDVRNRKTWTDGNGGGYSCSCCYQCGLTVDWEGCITSRPLYCSNDKLAVDLLGPSFDLSHNLFLERGTHAPVVYTTTHYLILVREVKETPATPENMEAIVVFNITPADATFNKDIFLTLGVGELPTNALNVSMAYYDDVNGVWELLDSEAGGPSGVAELTLSAPINHFSIFGVLAELEPTPPPAPAIFVGSGLSIEPSVEKIWEPVTFVTKTGESVTISATLTNDGGQEDTYVVELKLNGETVDTKTVLLSAGLSAQVSFTITDLDYGQYEVEVAGLSGEFTASRTITWWLIVVIIVGIGLIIWGVVWARRRRRARQQEA